MTQAKAIIGGILSTLFAGASSLVVVLTGDATLAQVTQGQWLAVIIAMLVAGGASYGIVFNVTNSQPNAIVVPSEDAPKIVVGTDAS